MIGKMETATATQVQNNFGRYLTLIQGGTEVIITRNGKEVGRLVPKEKTSAYLTDSLTGILKENADIDQARYERLKEKYEITD
jgi:prevent-host-death family protein